LKHVVFNYDFASIAPKNRGHVSAGCWELFTLEVQNSKSAVFRSRRSHNTF